MVLGNKLTILFQVSRPASKSPHDVRADPLVHPPFNLYHSRTLSLKLSALRVDLVLQILALALTKLLQKPFRAFYFAIPALVFLINELLHNLSLFVFPILVLRFPNFVRLAPI